MKTTIKILFMCVISMMSLSSCVESQCTDCTNNVQIEPLTRDNSSSLDYPIKTKEFTYKNHNYIYFETGNAHRKGGVIHDPECPCHNNSSN